MISVMKHALKIHDHEPAAPSWLDWRGEVVELSWKGCRGMHVVFCIYLYVCMYCVYTYISYVHMDMYVRLYIPSMIPCLILVGVTDMLMRE